MWRRFSITYIWLCLIPSTLIYIIRGHDVRSFDDTVHFKINWPGESTSSLVPDVELYPITTANHERYQCSMPYTKKPEYSETESYTGPNPIEILSPLFMQAQCFHKLDSYWTYEICHGRYVRQYHEDREGKKIKLQEYYLGTYNKTQKLKLATEYEEREKNPNRKAEIPVKRVDSTNMPYVEIEMTDGTVCDLNNKPRKIKVLYVCSQDMQHEVYSLKETSSCEYEAIIRTSLLCNHPDYKPQDMGENEINCRPVDKARRKPKALTLMEMESMELRHQKVPGNDPHYVVIFHVDKEGQDGEPRVRVEIRPVDFPDQHSSNEDLLTPIASQLSPAEIDPVQNFLSSQHCLHGGNGWWKYEFCHGRYVAQYHVEKDGTKTTVDLGKFDKQKHVDWIIAHPNKKPSLSKKTISHFYSDGSICDKTGKLRQTEVILKCVEMPSLSSVSLSLLEYKTCEYILKVESPIICGILEYTDEYGLLDDNKIKMNFGKVQPTSYQINQDDLNERIANGDD